jgi:hypothetical protein
MNLPIDPNDETKQPHPLGEINHRLKYPVMTRYGLFPDSTHGPCPHDTKRLLEELIAYQRGITGNDNLVEYFGTNFDVICAVTIRRHKSDKAFWSYLHRRGGDYVKDIVEQMGIDRTSKKEEKVALEKSNPENGARR